MAALTEDRDTFEAAGILKTKGLSASVKAIKGGIAVMNGAYAEPGTTATGLVAVGVFTKTVDNSSGSDGDVDADIKAGVFQFENSAGADEITDDDIGSDCYIVDDQTVALTDGTSTRSKCGRIVDVVDSKPLVATGTP